jgi:hypothetical protein
MCVLAVLLTAIGVSGGSALLSLYEIILRASFLITYCLRHRYLLCLGVKMGCFTTSQIEQVDRSCSKTALYRKG